MLHLGCRARASFFMRCVDTGVYVSTQNSRNNFREWFALAPAQYPRRVPVPEVPAVLSCSEAPPAIPSARFRLRLKVTPLTQSNRLCYAVLSCPLFLEPNLQSIPRTPNLLTLPATYVPAVVHEPELFPSLLHSASYIPIFKLHFPPSLCNSRTLPKEMSHSVVAAVPHDNGVVESKVVKWKQLKTTPQRRTEASRDPLRRIRGVLACRRESQP
ncbi:hypothetical protein M758_2G201800 [Ceratodon purpureus]|nr:hypothetical protein M758_2G201800 [Ceratodon purpureus]